jgi:hypothetical protein
MKATFATIGALLPLAFLPAFTQACTPCYVCSPVFHVPLPVAPSLCNTTGCYYALPDFRGELTVYGPNYYLRPPCPPFNGMLPGNMGNAIRPAAMPPGGMPPGYGPPPGMMPYPPMPPMPGMENLSVPRYSGPANPTVVFPYHPHVRSPRDFFMWRENMEDRTSNEARPRLVP